ncbi:MAG: Coenzyme F420 hydrogenase/dehydrogenase, beta subunit C-terminal domain [Oscillospiraceae bacterium]|nr:Coenzyme F420 hydrogenase/dehydrogenase, beta subunit C-terminal domain [Oscillospiraceae bacterium]
MKEPKEKKPLAIVSMQRVVNFGSVLQAYSLRTLLKELYDGPVCFLDIDEKTRVPVRENAEEEADYASEAHYPPGLLQKAKRWSITRLSSCNKRLIRRFMTRELGLDETRKNETYEAVVVGSDEVFNHKGGLCLQLHGDVPQTERVFTYAASCGSAKAENIPQEALAQVKAAMARFSALSVRDRATQEYAAALGSTQVQRHLDPVLVGDLFLRRHRRVPIQKYLLVYAYGYRIRTDEEIGAIKAFAKQRGLKTVAVGGSQFWCDLYLPMSPMRVLDYFHHADFVVTDTFHGAVFSVLEQRPFAVLQRQGNRGKITGLLEDLSLTDRLVSDSKDLETVLTRPIDYDRIEALLRQERERTKMYLKQALGQGDVSALLPAVPHTCTGCGACVYACPQEAIRMQEDEFGFVYPAIDETLCVRCGCCTKLCAQRENLEKHLPVQAHAAFGADEKTVRNSASGGVFASLAESTMAHGGMAAGAVMTIENGEVQVRHILSENPEDILLMQGSKYVHSQAWHSYGSVAQAVQTGKTVLFSGTPCQVAAVKALLDDPEKLVTMDIVCHGVPPVRLLDGFLKTMEKRLGGKIRAFRFRDKTGGKAYCAKFEMHNGRSFLLKSNQLSFYKYFLQSHICRENCYNCPYAGLSRVSDLTVGDYWGIEKRHEAELANGTMPKRADWSAILVNTEKGRRFLKAHEDALCLWASEPYLVAQDNAQLNAPCGKSSKRKEILSQYAAGGYKAVERGFIKENGGYLRYFKRFTKDLYQNNKQRK